MNRYLVKIASLILYFIFWNSTSLLSQNIYDTLRTVKMTAIADPFLENLTVQWTDDPGDNIYHLYKKRSTDDNWGNSILTTNDENTIYVDHDVEKGALYEYRILKESGDSLGYGYLFSGVDYEPVQTQGDVLILLEAAAQPGIQSNLNKYLDILKSEGWNPHIGLIAAGATVPEVKSIILTAYENVSDLNTIILMGNIPVPHSGNINPDGHSDHRGAWPTDVYYGDIDGIWTDEIVSNTTSAYPRLHNVPGDGKFDQDFIPGETELAVGRLDFSELPVFDLNEYELLNRYLEKNIAFRTGEEPVRRRAVFKNRNPWLEGLGQNAIRNFVPLVSNDSIIYEDFLENFGESFLWSYGGSSGSMTSSNGLGNINTYANSNIFGAVFTAYFGSYYGDYDFENNYLRVILGSGKVLSTAWVGAPNWYFHPMGMGMNLGFCTRMTQNNTGLYYAGFFPKSVTINLLGDPTLKSFIVKAPQDLTAVQQGAHIHLDWSPVTDDLLGYQVYRKSVEADYFTLLNQMPVTETSLVDSCVSGSTEFEYTVRAVKREVTPSGTFINRSSGPVILVETDPAVLPVADFELIWENDTLRTINQSVNASTFQWLLPDGTVFDTENFSVEYFATEDIPVRLIAANECFSDTFEQKLLVSVMEELTGVDLFTIYPNPADDILNFDNQKEVNEIVLFNVLGQRMKTFLSFPPGRHQLDLKEFKSGLYSLKVKFPDKSFSRMVFLE